MLQKSHVVTAGWLEFRNHSIFLNYLNISS